MAATLRAPVALAHFDGAWHELQGCVRSLVAATPAEVPGVLEAVEAAAAAGGHAVGFVAYEAARAFGLACHEPAGGLPLAAFAVYERLAPYDPAGLVAAAAHAEDVAWRPALARDAYTSAVARVRHHLAAGDTYQVNLTFPMEAPFTGDPFALFARLARAQRPACALYFDLGRFAICAASPETFFTRDGDTVTMRPMKGTAPRGRTLAEDRRRAAALRRSPKERAENLMIVDMVRNDLGRLARPGSVAVPALFEVERFPTILQMTSTVVAETAAPLADLFAATFPCASVTGAPKVRTAALIRELEAGPRGVYCGAAGYVGPGRRARFAVTIRTATVDRERGHATYGVGSGIVWDSRPGREYAECLAKARVLAARVDPFSLLETMRWDPGEGFALGARHLRRQASSARYFGIPYDRRRAGVALAAVAKGAGPLRVRLLVDEDGAPRAEAVPLPALAPGPVHVGLAAAPVDATDPFLYHKTTRREVYERAKASRPDCAQVILWNAAGMVTETDISNLALERGGQWVTPPVADGVLAGTLRAELLARGVLVEGPIAAAELGPSAKLAVFNSVRGWQEAVFVEG